MKTVVHRAEITRLTQEMRQKGRRIIFVPTMGALHEGHLTLFQEGKKRGDILVVSIFVNPTQFNDKSDFKKYPRHLESDVKKCVAAGVDFLFTPEVEDIYPGGDISPKVSLPSVALRLEGVARPGHFQGVVEVVSRLFRMVQPHVAIFGLKDYQQYRVIQEMVKNEGFDIEIVCHPTIRTREGLAMSSRNERISEAGREKALLLFKSLKAAQYLVEKGEYSTEKIIAKISPALRQEFRIDYIEIVDANSLEPLTVIDRPALLALAVFIENVRLIDNGFLSPATPARV